MRRNMGRRGLITSVLLSVAASLWAGVLSCGDSSENTGSSFPIRVEVSGLDQQNGIFDAAPTEDGSGRLWMSYSIVEPSAGEPNFPLISTRVAFSDSAGSQWQDAGVINSAETVTLPPPYNGYPAAWVNEVSRLVFDQYETDPDKKWKILWLRYLTLYYGSTLRLFEHSWIGLKTAPTPTGTWSSERKLFTGSAYTTADNLIIGSPEFPLDQLFSGPTATSLDGCLAFTEPGFLPAPDGLLVSLVCSEGATGGKTILLKCDRGFTSCDYPGVLIDDAEVSAFNTAYNGFSGSELVSKGSDTYLIVTPTEGDAKLYRGCLVFRINDLATASLQRTAGIPDLIRNVSGTSGSFNGACGYTAGSTGSGIMYGEYFPGQTPEFRLFGSGQNL